MNFLANNREFALRPVRRANDSTNSRVVHCHRSKSARSYIFRNLLPRNSITRPRGHASKRLARRSTRRSGPLVRSNDHSSAIGALSYKSTMTTSSRVALASHCSDTTSRVNGFKSNRPGVRFSVITKDINITRDAFVTLHGNDHLSTPSVHARPLIIAREVLINRY